MNIFINGKEVDASKITLQEVVEGIFGKQYNDIPEEYNSPDEYLMLEGLDLNLDKCDTKEKVNNLSEKLKKRLAWIMKHKNYKYDNIVEFLKNNITAVTDDLEALNNATNAHKLVLGYINSVIENTKKK